MAVGMGIEVGLRGGVFSAWNSRKSVVVGPVRSCTGCWSWGNGSREMGEECQ